jgi:uncharacterized protein YdeI (YjbR/CyaY-like superfamily)
MSKEPQRLHFKSRGDFRAWLAENAQTSGGVWLVFGKTKAVASLSAAQALEEALCFGWIDGQIKSVDGDSYLKYFRERAKNSSWSEKNQRLAEKLEREGAMTDAGRAKIECAKQNGAWGAGKKPGPLSEGQLSQFCDMVKPFGPAYANLMKMPPSARKSYASSYFFGAKTEEGKQKRLAAVIERLNLNLNPVQSMKKALEKLE